MEEPERVHESISAEWYKLRTEFGSISTDISQEGQPFQTTLHVTPGWFLHIPNVQMFLLYENTVMPGHIGTKKSHWHFQFIMICKKTPTKLLHYRIYNSIYKMNVVRVHLIKVIISFITLELRGNNLKGTV